MGHPLLAEDILTLFFSVEGGAAIVGLFLKINP